MYKDPTKYMDKSYWIEPEIWSEKDLSDWAKMNCPKGNHLFDEVFSEEHYLFCDACGKVDYNIFQEVKPVSQTNFFIQRLKKSSLKEKFLTWLNC
jgi:hypothetical protein